MIMVMNMRFEILGSSSSGNCAYLETPGAKILIDAGFSGRKIEGMLKEIGESIENIDAVFLTHEHADHSTGLRGLAKHPHLTYHANRDTARALQERLVKPLKWHLFETGSSFVYKDMQVTSFSIPHDAYDPVGYIFKNTAEHGKSLAWVTDLGYIPELVAEKIRQVELLVLESNYERHLLEQDEKRPFSIKQRILGRHGHLSNEDAYDFISQSNNTKWEKVHLAHLSKDCNDTDLLKNRYEAMLANGVAFDLEIIDPERISIPAY